MKYNNSFSAEILWYAAVPELKKTYRKAVEFHDNLMMEPYINPKYYTFKGLCAQKLKDLS